MRNRERTRIVERNSWLFHRPPNVDKTTQEARLTPVPAIDSASDRKARSQRFVRCASVKKRSDKRVEMMARSFIHSGSNVPPRAACWMPMSRHINRLTDAMGRNSSRARCQSFGTCVGNINRAVCVRLCPRRPFGDYRRGPRMVGRTASRKRCRAMIVITRPIIGAFSKLTEPATARCQTRRWRRLSRVHERT